jgi:hypothetical protein
MVRNLFREWLAPRKARKPPDLSGGPATTSCCWRPHFKPLVDRLAPAIVKPFTVRFTINDVGNPGRTQQDVINAQNGVGPNTDNHVARPELKKVWLGASPRS